MTETTTQQPAPDTSSCPDCRRLLTFAELDEMIAAGTASPEQLAQHDELAREISGNPQSGEAVAAVLARALADARHRANLVALEEIEHGGDPVLNWMAANVALEQNAVGDIRPNKKKSRAKIDEFLQRLTREFGRERLAKDPGLAILPSGDAISVRSIRSAFFITDDVKRKALAEVGFLANLGDLVIDHFGSNSDYTIVYDAEDIAAMRAALFNIGVTVNAPTIAGEDRDGDGRTGE